MATSVRRVLTGLTRASLGEMIITHKATSAVRWHCVRSLALSCLRSAKSKPTEDEVNKPIKFSTSKASHRTWKVDNSMGSHFQQPYWKVLSISLFAAAFILWCALRENTDIDKQLDTDLFEHLPALRPQEDEDEIQKKSE
ncbi:ubiquinol-cytochrome-c reductase complex assembly factor 4 isoform X2 [Betta splendens]|uniref:Ubiquinol-cytochrome-c reductase complex assembly factor 4 isoform X2 n=1 Tax=Betta splendens TaxID=158456 RepID=A0A8M1H7C4_BETSP|nr:ubiquinol-cytochrome-c reductase complex assembly factor 4 isoform X2 [Betta splendens]